MIEINADLCILAKIKLGDKTYELKEIEYDHLMELRSIDKEDSDALEAATFKILEASGLPKDVVLKFSPRVIRQLEKVVVGGFDTQKK